MKHSLHSLLALFIAACFACHSASTDTAKSADASPSKPRAIESLDAMLDGTWTGDEFPQVEWKDVAPLLARAESTRTLRNYPANPISSQRQVECEEGVMALWMIEGVRRNAPNGFPSLNPLLLGGPEDGTRTWQQISRRNHPRAAIAYRAWWDRVEDSSVAVRRADDPLAGTTIAWH